MQDQYDNKNILPSGTGVPQEDNQELLQFVGRMLAHWRWFLASALIFLIAGFLYIRYSTPIYRTTAKLLVVDEKKGGAGLDVGVIGDFGGMMGMKSNVDNEVEILKTYDLMKEVVLATQGHIVYKTEGRIKTTETLDPAFLVQVITPTDSIFRNTFFSIKGLNDKGKLQLKSDAFDLEVGLDQLLSIPNLGYIRISKNPDYTQAFKDDYKGIEQEVEIHTINGITGNYMGNLTIGVTNKQTSTIDLAFNHSIPKKGENILRTLVDRYVIRTLEDKNTIADSTLAFIDERLLFVGEELGMAEAKIQDFKQQSQVADISTQSKILLENASDFAKDLASVESQIIMLEEVDRYLADPRQLKVVPTTIADKDPTFSALVQQYNRLLLDRERLLLSHTVDNPVVKNVDQQIASMRENMRSTVSSARRQLSVTRNSISRQANKYEAEIRRVPATERSFLDLSRQQQIKQELYLYLQQKWEETAISKTANISHAKMIDSPRTGGGPISPKRNIILLGCLLIGLLIPFAILYLQDLLNVRVRTKDDITSKTNIAVMGEIMHAPHAEENSIVVTRESRTPIAEQFRALRTNLDFFQKSEGCRTILMTSSMSGEGKSFVAVNLANTLALLGKKVAVLEFDLRKPTVSKKFGFDNQHGFTNYVLQPELLVSDIVKKSRVHELLDIVSSGPLPPNPAEIILHPRTKELFDELKAHYEYIVVDAPPIGVVTDAQLLSQFADNTLYVVRIAHTFKKQLEIPNDIVQQDKMPKVGIVINAIDASRAGGYGYGYGYGYYDAPKGKPKFSFLGKLGSRFLGNR